ncbi:hypothetical protein VD0002_g7089 [Verticillium dahliae]|nr:hypothetical protein VD0003_g8602 [Verticillium dahliae]PNH60546.1 hypothetical protein VD0002_g7089 [Verticillium dahliae]PNH64725.1 hypothetical protein VD0001_g8742 [Verticillium dahliae]
MAIGGFALTLEPTVASSSFLVLDGCWESKWATGNLGMIRTSYTR